ncbi:MAG TPA: hypothetical protein VMU51_14940 [Mycobacteriales bacterium]|nr:hypothetical protein [Mycobacteriales bacterium]
MSRPRRPLTEAQARLLTRSTEPWLSCEDCFAQVDGYVEDLLAGAAGTDRPELAVHLAGCPACAEEAESLLLLVADQDGVDPAPALRQLPGRPG